MGERGIIRYTARAALISICLLVGVEAPSLNAAESGRAERKLLPLTAIQIDDAFWAPKLKVYRERTIPHSWNYMGWEIRALEKANGRTVTGELNGTWGEANLYKFLETLGHSLAMNPDPELEKRMDEIIGLLRGAQQPDGYLHAYITNEKKLPWDPGFLDGSHDGYVLGHMIEAALAHYTATGNRSFLDLACRAADQAHAHFLGPPGHPGFCGHAELEMALVELFRVVPEPRYLALARAFIEWRGRNQVKPFSETPRAYFQDQEPFREQKTLEGHAVRAIFFATGVADVALETGDADYRLAANRFWDSTARRRMNIAGGIGPRPEHEALGEDYELPNEGYYESCAACGLANFAQRMFLLEGRAEGAEVLERVLYNAVLHGISLDGTNTYYQNPLSDRNHARDNCWVCCPPNISRTLTQIGRYAYAYGERDLWINLYVGGTVTAPLKAGPVTVAVATDYPWGGRVEVTVRAPSDQPFALNLRLPAWCEKARMTVNGADQSPLPRDDRGYLRLDRQWHPEDRIELRLEMPVVRLEAHPNIASCAGKVALRRGSVLYAFEGLDNGDSARIELGADPQFQVEHRDAFLGGVTVIKGVSAEGKPFLAVPFYALANRGASAQEVWAVQRGLKPSAAWWLGELYRPVRPERLALPAN